MNMQQMFIKQFSPQKRGIFYLTVVWILGIVLGAAIVAWAGDTYLIVKYTTVSRPDFGLLFLSNAFPITFLIVLFATQRYGLIYVFLFSYGLLRGFCGMCIVFAFGSSGWLVRCFLLFSSGIVSVLIWWLIFSFESYKRRVLMLFFGALLFVCIFTLVDYFAVSPFLIGVL